MDKKIVLVVGLILLAVIAFFFMQPSKSFHLGYSEIESFYSENNLSLKSKLTISDAISDLSQDDISFLKSKISSLNDRSGEFSSSASRQIKLVTKVHISFLDFVSRVIEARSLAESIDFNSHNPVDLCSSIDELSSMIPVYESVLEKAKDANSAMSDFKSDYPVLWKNYELKFIEPNLIELEQMVSDSKNSNKLISEWCFDFLSSPSFE